MIRAQGDRARRWLRGLAGVHGAYFVLTGLWPLVHMQSFLAVTGPKTDIWLVKFFGALICVPGCMLLRAAQRGDASGSLLFAAVGFPVVLAGGDVACVAQGIISPIYLADAAVEAALLFGWSLYLVRTKRAGPRFRT
jgi:hypothetical protein